MRIQYQGCVPCYTVPPAPSLDWEPGQIRELDAPIISPGFVVLPDDTPTEASEKPAK